MRDVVAQRNAKQLHRLTMRMATCRPIPVVALLSVLAAGCGRTPEAPTDLVESNHASDTKTAQADHDQALATNGSPIEQLLAERFRPPGILCGSNQACLDSPLVASTPEELAWLRANGYPSLRELLALRRASSETLASEVGRGSRTAMVVLGARLVGQRREREGLVLLVQATKAGSIYAYYEVSNAYLRSPRLANRIEAAAYMRVAYLLGDVKAAGELQRRFSELGPVEQVFVDERASSLYRTFAGSRKPNPRPVPAE